MTRAVFIAWFWGLICVHPHIARPQSINAEAQAAVQAVGSLSEIFTQEKIDSTVETFETANPKETGYNRVLLQIFFRKNFIPQKPYFKKAFGLVCLFSL